MSIFVSKTMPEAGAARRSTATSRHLVIFLHGIRGSGRVMAQIGNAWKARLPDTRFVAPNAPFPNRSQGYQWFAVDDQVMRPDRIMAARSAFDTLVGGIIDKAGFENDLDKVAFVGVSQGAIMALDAVATGRWKVGALVTFAGFMPFPPVNRSGTDTAVYLMHGGNDRTIPPAASVAAASQLKAAGFTVTSRIFPGVGHTISAEEAEEALTFLRQRFGD
ncbi:alpha/beta hydrolase [Rhizobium sp. 9140]|uniref:alpha/beta hydrolase n=1 Tax=Rhizobium sp. 9140 TaxID=1761900 RepID=UPI001FDA16A8|nr:prolyl oligopeptidase family serine peptidase [Rhizobium sp. 9140]